MPTLRNWEEWEEGEEPRSRSGQLKKPARYEPDEEKAARKQQQKRRPKPAQEPFQAAQPPSLAEHNTWGPAPEILPPAPAVTAPAVTPPPVEQPAQPGSPPPIQRRNMRGLLSGQALPERQSPQELTPQQVARTLQRDASPRQIVKFIEQGVSPLRLASILGTQPETIQQIYQSQVARGQARQAVNLYEQGHSFPQIGEKLGVSETQARDLYSRGHLSRYGSDPAVQYGLKQKSGRKALPADLYPEQPRFTSSANQDSPILAKIMGQIGETVAGYGYELNSTFEPDPFGGRHVINIVKNGRRFSEPFRLSATPGGVPLLSKTGKGPGGFRYEFVKPGDTSRFTEQILTALPQAIANFKARRPGGVAFDEAAPDFGPDEGWGESGGDTGEYSPDISAWDEGYVPELPEWMREGPPSETPATGAVKTLPAGEKKLPGNILDILDVAGKRRERGQPKTWRHLDYSFMALSHGGRFAEERAESLVRNERNALEYPGRERLGYDPILYNGTVYPITARNFIPGNVRVPLSTSNLSPERKEAEVLAARADLQVAPDQMSDEALAEKLYVQLGSQKDPRKQDKPDRLSLSRKYDQAGPALGIAYPQYPQHILGQYATEPEYAHRATAFIMQRGGIIPEGQMWMDEGFAPWVFNSFERNPEKYQIRYDDQYSEEEVLRAAGLPPGRPEGAWDEEKGGFKPRLLRPGQRVGSPSGFKKNIIGNNEAAVITGHQFIEGVNERGWPVKILQLEGYAGNQSNVIGAVKIEGYKNLAQKKKVRERLGLDVDMVVNKPSDPLVAMIGSLNALPRQELEDLWQQVHGHRNVPQRTESREDLKAVAKAYGRLYQKGFIRNHIMEQVADSDTLQAWEEAGIVVPGSTREEEPYFSGAEPMYRALLRVSGSRLPARARFITNVTSLRQGRLSNETLNSVDTNIPGLGGYLREQGFEQRDIYNTLYEMYRLNKQPDFDKVGSPIADVLADLSNPEIAAALSGRQQAIYQDILPAALSAKIKAAQRLDKREAATQQKLYRQAGQMALEQYYGDQFGTDSFIFRIGDAEWAAYMINPEMTERFGYVDELENETISKLATLGREALGQVWDDFRPLPPLPGGKAGAQKKSAVELAMAQVEGVMKEQEALLASAGARKKWFGTSHTSIFTHVHASDYSLPRNAAAAGWDDILRITGLKKLTPQNRAYLNALSQQGQLLHSGLRNPNSDPMAQTATVLNMLTPDIIKGAGLDISTAGHPLFFHAHQVQAQGGDNDSDQSQVYLLLKHAEGAQSVAGGLVNAFDLKPTGPELITERARRHAAGEYTDAQSKLKVLGDKQLKLLEPEQVQEAIDRQAAINILGFDPGQGEDSLSLTEFGEKYWASAALSDWERNRVQIGQAYNYPIRVGIPMAKGNKAAQDLISEYGGWLYQNPLDKKVYADDSPEADFFKFFSSFDPILGSYEDGAGGKYSYRYHSKQGTGFPDAGMFGAGGLLTALRRMIRPRPQPVQARMTKEQFAAFMTRSTGLPDKVVEMLEKGTLPLVDMEQVKQVKGRPYRPFTLTENETALLSHFARGDSPLAQMMRGYAVHKAVKNAQSMHTYLTDRLPGELTQALSQGEMPQSLEAEYASFRNKLRNYTNRFQDVFYNHGGGIGSAELKSDWAKLLQQFGLDPHKDNMFEVMDPDKGDFYKQWDVQKRVGFYQGFGEVLNKHVINYRKAPILSEWAPDYHRVRSFMSLNARDSEEYESGFEPALDELEANELSAPLVNEKYNRKQKALSGLSRLFEKFKGITGRNGSTVPHGEFEAFVGGKLPYTRQEEEMWNQAERGHWDAYRLRYEQFKRAGGYPGRDDEPLYFAEGGVLDRATKLGETRGGRDIVAGEAGREYVVPEGKTRDLGGGVKVFDEDELGWGAPAFGTQSAGTTRLAKGGILDYQAYASAFPTDFETALRQVAYELSGGEFKGDAAAAKELVRQQIETDIQRLAANGPREGQPGLMASSMSGRATEMMALALGPNPGGSDFSAWNELLSEYGLSADLQPLGVNPQQIAPGVKQQLQQQAGGDKEAYRAP